MKKQLSIAIGLVIVSAVAALATFSNLSSGGFGSQVYDIAINKILQGPIGFISAMFAIFCGAHCAMTGKIMVSIPCILGGAAVLKAASLVASLGALI